MLLDLRIIIVHQIASRGRISSSRDILEGVSKLIENLLSVSLVGWSGICLLAVCSIIEGVNKLIESLLFTFWDRVPLWKYNWRSTKNSTCYCFSFLWRSLIICSYCFRKMAPPPPPPCRLCKSRCASSLATGKLFGIYFQPSFRHAAVRN